MNLSTTIKTIQDIMRKDSGVDGDAQRISQIVWMIFLKVFDAKEEEWELEDSSIHVGWDKQYGRLELSRSDELHIAIPVEDLQQLKTIIEKIVIEKYHSWKGIML